jgi:hypothetical protein
MRLALAIFFYTVGCSPHTYNTDEVVIEELNMERSRQIAEDFVRSNPDFMTNNGKDLTLLAEEPLRCRLCWAFDFRYVVLVNGKPYGKYVTVTVQEGKASMAIPVKEGMPRGE